MTGGPNFEQMRGELMTTVRSLERRRRIKVRAGIAGGVALAAAAAATGAAWVVQAPRDEIDKTVYCYEKASITSRHGQAMAADAAPTATPGTDRAPAQQHPDRITEAIEQCAAAWRVGVWDANASKDAVYPVPELFACTRHDGVLAVFPQPAGAPVTCDDLGLRPAR